MGRISSSIGIITGVPIADTVDQLMAVSARPRDMLIERTETMQREQVAVTELSALLTSVKFISDSLGKTELYERQKATSSNEAAVSARVTGTALSGTYQFTPVRTSQQHQLLSTGFRQETDPLGEGFMTFRYGSHVEQGLSLDHFGGGAGVERGFIRITDRSGASAQVDLTAVQTVDDVLDAINGTTGINVTAEASGDGFALVDHTGSSFTNLKVQEVGGGKTAASLGLDAIDSDAATAAGRDMLYLSRDLDLNALNDGLGIVTDHLLHDLEFEFADGTTGFIDLSPLKPNSNDVQLETTLGEVMDRINEKYPSKVKIEIAPDGDRLILSDLTEGENEFKIESKYGSRALRGLGLDGEVVDGQVVGRKIMGGTKSVLLSSLKGGHGFDGLGSVELTDRTGATATVDLAGAETLDEVIGRINESGVEVKARVNDSRNGIFLADVSAGTGSFKVASVDDTETAEKLRIDIDSTTKTSVDSGDFNLHTVNRNTLLEDLNGGRGVARGRITMTDSVGNNSILDLSKSKIQTVGDVIDEINRLDVRVFASMNETGDGILLKDQDRGEGKFVVSDLDSTAASDLHFLGEVLDREFNEETHQVIDGSTAWKIKVEEGDTLDDLRQAITALDAGVRATTFFDGSAKPYRLAITSEQLGGKGQLVVDTSNLGASFQETVAARDALMMLGAPDGHSTPPLVASPTNTFESVIPGVTLDLHHGTGSPVSISVQTTDSDLVANVKVLVDNYNKFRKKLNSVTAYDVQNNSKAVLAGDSTALRLDTDLSNFLSGRFHGVGSIKSLGEIGISFLQDGTLSFDETRLKQAFAEDPDAVEEFFTDEDRGFSKRFGELFEQLNGTDTSLMAYRFKALNTKIERNSDRILDMNARLENQRNQMLLEFYRMESAIAKMQGNMNALGAITPIAPTSLSAGQ